MCGGPAIAGPRRFTGAGSPSSSVAVSIGRGRSHAWLRCSTLEQRFARGRWQRRDGVRALDAVAASPRVPRHSRRTMALVPAIWESPLPDSNRRPLPYHGRTGCMGMRHVATRWARNACSRGRSRGASRRTHIHHRADHWTRHGRATQAEPAPVPGHLTDAEHIITSASDVSMVGVSRDQFAVNS